MLSDDEDVETKRLIFLLFVVPVFASFLLKLYVVWQYSDAGATAFLFILALLALAIIALWIGKHSIIFGAGLLILTVSFFLTMTSFITVSEEWRLIEILTENPNAYADIVNSTVYYDILPIVVGLLLCIVGFVMQRRKLNGFDNLLLLITGFFFSVWGIHYFQATIENHIEAINTALQSDAAFLEGTLNTIYTLYKIIGLLWLVIGIFFIAISAPLVYWLWKTRRKAAEEYSDYDSD